jgi:hypothetical protein
MTVNSHTPLGANGGRRSDSKSDALPRLLSLKQAEAIYGISYWKLRDYVNDGLLPCVRLPGGRLHAKGGRIVANCRDHLLRKILIDRVDLDKFIADCKKV